MAERRNCGPSQEIAALDVDRGRWRVRFWQRACAQTEDGFVHRLRRTDLSEEQFLRFAAETSSSLALRCTNRLPWVDQLASDYVPYLSGVDARAEPHLDIATSHPFCVMAAPIAARSFGQLEQFVANLRLNLYVPLDDILIHTLFRRQLLKRIHSAVHRTLILELNSARLLGQLEGHSPAERFSDFVSQLRRPKRSLSLFLRYPVLARQVILIADLWLDASREFLSHLAQDWSEIIRTVSTQTDPGKVVRVRFGAGDEHQGGKSVILLRFESGMRLVYKPRSLAVEHHFAELLRWVNQKMGTPLFRPLKIVDRGERHGWVEFAAAKPCVSEDQLRLFYFQQGGYLALLYLLDGTDIHYENVIAAGENPIVVDVETLFHPLFGRAEEVTAQTSYFDYLNSVMRSTLLPHRGVRDFGDVTQDLSGLAASPGEVSEIEGPVVEGFGTDEMRVVAARLPRKLRRHLPTLNGVPVELAAYTESIVEGFEAVYRLLALERAELVAPRGPIAIFADDLVRVVFRRTSEYDLLISQSYHPDLMRNALDREGLLEKLWRATRQAPWLTTVLPFEHDDIMRGDIPYFTAKPTSRHLWTSDGTQIHNFLPEAPLDRVLNRLNKLDEEDLARQVWYIRASIACNEAPASTERRPSTFTPIKTNGELCKTELLAAAEFIGKRIIRLAHEGAEDLSWVGITLVGPDRFGLQPLHSELYSGLSGVALFLGYLGLLSAEQSYVTLARKTLNSAKTLLGDTLARSNSIGAFSGASGYLYAVSELATICQAPLLEEIFPILEALKPKIEIDQRCDLISGSAGMAAVLLRLYEQTGSPEFLSVAGDCARNIVKRALPQETGVGWKTIHDGLPLAGFSHGAAGMWWALRRVAQAIPSAEYEETARAALSFERSLFVDQEQNWERSRGNRGFSYSWCHGAPGIALARLSLLKHQADAAMEAEVGIAIKSTLKNGFGVNHSLCHGDLGNLDFLSIASRVLGDHGLHRQTMHRLRSVLDTVVNDGWICGTPRHLETPGLMCGLAGIGYGLLRLIEPERVPCVLLLSGPI